MSIITEKKDSILSFILSYKTITLIPSVLKDLVIDALSFSIASTTYSPRNRNSHNRGNVQHRLGGTISDKEHDEIVSKAHRIIRNM